MAQVRLWSLVDPVSLRRCGCQDFKICGSQSLDHSKVHYLHYLHYLHGSLLRKKVCQDPDVAGICCYQFTVHQGHLPKCPGSMARIPESSKVEKVHVAYRFIAVKSKRSSKE